MSSCLTRCRPILSGSWTPQPSGRRIVICRAHTGHSLSRRDSLLASGLALTATSLPPPAAARSSLKLPPALPVVDLVPRAVIAEDLVVSQVIKGCWQLDGEHVGDARTDRTSATYAIEDFERFVAAGITTFDTADLYGPSESLIGRYLRLYPDRRNQVQVLTKLCFMLPGDMEGISRESVEYAVRAALLRMGLEQLDMVQLFWGSWDTKGYLDVALWLADLKQQGLLRHVGVTNFDTAHLARLVDAGVPVTCNQVQWSVLDRRPELLMAGYCKRHNIALLPHGTCAGGFLSSTYLDMEADQARLDTLSKLKYGTLIQELGGWPWFQRMLQALAKVAQRHGTSISSIASKWALQRPRVAAVVLGARNPSHIPEHQLLSRFRLDDQDLVEIDAAYETATKPTSDCYAWERGAAW